MSQPHDNMFYGEYCLCCVHNTTRGTFEGSHEPIKCELGYRQELLVNCDRWAKDPCKEWS
jgi:hypothetical protein